MSERNFEFLTTVTPAEARSLIPLLEDNDIIVMKKDQELGGLLEVYGQNTLYEIDLYVPADQLEKATELVEFMEAEPEEE